MTSDIRKANNEYEDWLRNELDGDIVKDAIDKKHEKMSAGPFPFLRATYWRWAETILTVCPKLADAPACLAVGDIHLENFGTWRDDDGRLVWGVNDFDEAADMPYALDLVRLAASAILGRPARALAGKDVCASILEGYGDGLDSPRPFVLDDEHGWLRVLVVVPEAERRKFWDKVGSLKPPKQPATKPYVDALEAAMPEGNIEITVCRRSAGIGSLGRPRWVGFGEWRGGRVVREAKAMVTSGWIRATKQGSGKLRCKEIAFGQYRAADPWFDVTGNIAVRRLSPNSRKIEVEDMPGELLQSKMLRAMGHELANVHLGTGNPGAAIARDLKVRDDGWLREAASTAAEFVQGEFEAWCKG
jgi:hypothetical protein